MNIAEVMTRVCTLFKEHGLNISTGVGHVLTHDDKEWTLECPKGQFIELSNETRQLAFGSVEELIGWLRCYRSFTMFSA